MTTTKRKAGDATRECGERIARFASPATRLLLAGDGLTTRSLQAWASAVLTVGSLAWRVRDRHGLPVGMAADVLGEHERLVVRRSTLVDPAGAVWSANEVVGRLDLDARATACLQGPGPLGPALLEAGVSGGRSLLDVGRMPWPLAPGARAAAYRLCLLRHGDEPLCVVREIFNPALIETGLRPEWRR
ncbi:hypothetical protein [Streptomyces sp. CRN 30]|uniref:hypothetical protein n=1 Tax=Streptomyces sp. CRN 30 TaxID=3075613 RepID=UPI002A8257BF|nr:hypothetical protein [Streptomyces sp. CRN 30]